MGNGEDRRACETVLRTLGASQERLDRIRQRISDFREEWNNVRRPSRPAGPGRPRGHKRANMSDPMESIDPLPELTGVLPMLSQGAGVVMGVVGGHGAIVRKVPKKQPCKSKINAAASKGAAGVAHNGAGAASGLSGAGCLPGDLHNGRWQHPQGADSQEDYVLQSSQSDAAHGPVAAIIIEDEKSGLWHNSYQEWDESTPVSLLQLGVICVPCSAGVSMACSDPCALACVSVCCRVAPSASASEGQALVTYEELLGDRRGMAVGAITRRRKTRNMYTT